LSKTLVVISTHIDSTIREQLPTDKVFVYNTIEELREFIITTPIRADVMYITRDVLGKAVNSKLSILMEMLGNPFLSVKEVIYLTEPNSKELVSINYMIEEYSYSNWNIQFGSLNREYISSMISGTLRSEEIRPRRRAVVRVNREEYVREKLREGSPDEKFNVEEDELSEVPGEEVPEPQVSEVPKNCRIQTISGIRTRARTTFAVLFAQYLSFSGKVVLLENDLEYLTTSSYLHASGVNYLKVEIKDLYDDPKGTFRSIVAATERIVLVTDTERNNYSKMFLSNILYNNLKDHVEYLVLEKDFEELAPTTKFVTVIQNEMSQILRTTEAVPLSFKGQSSFAVVNDTSYREAIIKNSKQVKILLQDLLQDDSVEVMLLDVKSLKLGGEVHDLRMYVK